MKDSRDHGERREGPKPVARPGRSSAGLVVVRGLETEGSEGALWLALDSAGE